MHAPCPGPRPGSAAWQAIHGTVGVEVADKPLHLIQVHMQSGAGEAHCAANLPLQILCLVAATGTLSGASDGPDPE